MKKRKQKKPRNLLALAVKMRPRQIFHHKSAPKGGDRNLYFDWMNEYFLDVLEDGYTEQKASANADSQGVVDK